jgi:putative PIN family toxin of toxin-antitoxin system
MLAVVDTNVWVSAFLTPGGSPGQLLAAFRNGMLIPAYSRAIEAEYREVLTRPKFGIDIHLLAEFFVLLRIEGRRDDTASAVEIDLPDPTDAPFIALARHLLCPIVTGNTRHFPPAAGVEVLSPAECLAKLL